MFNIDMSGSARAESAAPRGAMSLGSHQSGGTASVTAAPGDQVVGAGRACVRGFKKSGACLAREQVWHGILPHTKGGLTLADLMSNKRGQLVAVKASRHAWLQWSKENKARVWNRAMMKARVMLQHEGEFVPCGGKSSQGRVLLLQTRRIFRLLLDHHRPIADMATQQAPRQALQNCA